MYIVFRWQTEDRTDGTDLADYIWGGWGNDTLGGGLGNDRILAGIGDDLLLGGEGRDTLDGGEGDDVLDAGPGGGTMTGGLGADSFHFGGEAGLAGEPLTVTDFRPEEGDTLQFLDSGEGAELLAAPDEGGYLVRFGEGAEILVRTAAGAEEFAAAIRWGAEVPPAPFA